MPHYSDSYNPDNTVAPTGGVSDYLTTKATPQEAGAGVGEAIEGLGQTLGKAADSQAQIELQKQGLANEHAATMGEMQLAVEGGKIYDGYKSLTGLDAANSKDKAVSDYTALSGKIRESLGNPAAQRAYDQMATRRLSFAIQDMNGYAATQRKDAYKNGRLSQISLAKDEASRPEVAGNQTQFNDSLGAVIFSTNDIFTNPDYGQFRTVPATTDPKTGKLQYDTSTQDGQIAQKSYDFYLQKETGDVFTNAATTLAADNPVKAHEFVERNKDQMSSATYAKLSHTLAPAVQAENVRKGVDDLYNDFSAEYQNNPTAGSPVDTLKTLFPGVQVTSTKRTPEQNATLPGASPTSNHLTGNAADFVAPPGVSLDQVKEQLQTKGFNIIEAIDQKDDPKTGEKAHYHIAWSPQASSDNPSFSNALGAKSPELIQKARDWAKNQGLGLTAQDQAEARMQTRISHVMTADQYANRANEDSIVRDLYAGKFPNQEALDKDPRFQLLNSRNSILAGNIVTRIMPAMARGMQSGYGKDFYSHLVNTLHGNEDTTSLSNYVGQDKNSPVTNTGFATIGKFLGKNEPQDLAFNKALGDYLDKLHGQYTGAKQFPGAFSPTESNDKWNQVLAEVIPRVMAGKASNKSADQMFNPDSKDFIQPGIKPPTLAEVMHTMVSRKQAGLTHEVPTEYGSLAELKKSIGTGAGKIPYGDAVKYAQKKGWIAVEGPTTDDVYKQSHQE